MSTDGGWGHGGETACLAIPVFPAGADGVLGARRERGLDPEHPADPERSVVDRFRRGDLEAFDELVAPHRRTIYLVARRMLRSHDEADEAAQRTLVRAWKGRGRFRGEAALRSWLVRIAINVVRSMRAPGRRTEALEVCAETVDPAAAADEQVQASEQRTRVREAVSRLPARQREVVQLKVLSEMTYREVAESMGLSEGAVKAHLHQAVGNLRRLMAERREDANDLC